MANPSDTWVYDPTHGVYYHASSNTYAIPDAQTGQWSYLPAQCFHSAGPSNTTSGTPQATPALREDGELDDDVGWGGLMDPEKLEAVIKSKSIPANAQQPEKHPAYQVYRARETTPPPKSTPSHILRLVVADSEVMSVGGVVVIDARDGGVQIGRDRCEKGGQARVRVKEMEVSKTHAVVYWGKGGDEEDGKVDGWWIVDLGSTHGTFITSSEAEKDTTTQPPSPNRLSEAKHSSRPYPLDHLSTLTIGATSLVAHIHPSWPCEVCQLHGDNEIHLDDGSTPIIVPAPQPEEEPEPVRWAMDSKEKRENRERKRKREMAMLRETLLRGNTRATEDGVEDEERGSEEQQRKYVDRSAMRRKLHPPSPPPPSRPNKETREGSLTPPRPSMSISEPAPPTSAFAMSMMANQGWTPGTGLGKNAEGRADPINVELRTEHRGLGAEGSKAVMDFGEGDWRSRGKQRRWEEMRKA